MIIGFRAKGGSISETAEFVNCSRAAVVKVYRAWQNGTVQNQRRGKCGAPRAIDDRGERRLRRCVRADRRATVEQLTTKMNQGATKSVSQSTIQRTLLRLGLRSRRLVRAPMLTAVHRRRRLEFARQYSSWTSTEWRQVAFSDESRFMLHRTDGRWRIRRETSERNHPATIAGTVQAGGGSIMVWGMFSWHSSRLASLVEGTMDQYKYASVLADHVHPYMRIVFPQDDGIFQQDNARCHTAASVRAWFEEHQDEFTVLPWPANSPDLNPIEHLWDQIDRVVRATDPQPRNLAQLATDCIVAITIHVEQKRLSNLTVYFSPAEELEPYLLHLENVFNLYNDFLILGDFNSENFNWGARDLDARGTTTYDFIAQNGLKLLNTKDFSPTFVSAVGIGWTDLVLCSDGLDVRNMEY
ncbi:Transposable element Tcb1 transposase, partial [Stegodyphus mimosarum]